MPDTIKLMEVKPKKNSLKKISEKSEISPIELPELTPSEIQVIKTACANAGMSIDNYVNVIKEALSATRMTVDKYGERHDEEDHAMRLKAALMGLELEGYIKSKAVATDNSKHTHVTYSWQPVQVINGASRIN